jgi:hypothetical protein
MPDALTGENTVRAIGDIRDEAWSRRSKAMGKVRAVAVAGAAAVAGAVAAAAAAAAADAVAAADADAVADAVAVAVADAVAADYEATYQAIYAKVKPIIMERTASIRARHTAAAFDLLDQMLPKEIIELPVVDDAEFVCGGALR